MYMYRCLYTDITLCMYDALLSVQRCMGCSLFMAPAKVRVLRACFRRGIKRDSDREVIVARGVIRAFVNSVPSFCCLHPIS